MLPARDEETIIACCTPQGSGAIALLRLSGADVFSVLQKIASLPSGQPFTELATHTIHYGWVQDENAHHIDQVLFLIMHGPRTFTGENVVEITCHNNPFIIQAIIKQALQNGARLATQGEFTRRAVLNGKIDLLQAEAINDLIHANTEMALKKSLEQLEGSLSHWISTIEGQLYKSLALCEASFEFIEEEGLEFGPQISTMIAHILTTIEQLKKTFDQQQQIRQGIRITLIGSVNAGKSSLFNALLGKQRAIVSNIAGTTRDTIEAGIYRNNVYLTLIDTAGLRQTDDVIEQEGIKRSFEEAQKADIVLLVCDGSQQLMPQEEAIYQELIAQHEHKIILVQTKHDLCTAFAPTLFGQPVIAVSSKTGAHITALEESIEQKIAMLLQNADSPFLLNKRQFNILLTLADKLTVVQSMLGEHIRYELVAHHLRDATEHLCELTGKSVSEKAMDTVFREFCVGK